MRGALLLRAACGHFFAGIFVCMALCAVATTPAWAANGNLTNNVLGMFPKDVSAFGYVDLESGQKSPLFSMLFDQFLPAHFEQLKMFAASGGVDFASQVKEIAWGTLGSGGNDAVVGVALGQFNPTGMGTQLQAIKVPMQTIQGYDAYVMGTGERSTDLWFVFLDSDTAAFGHRDALEQLLKVRTGQEESLLANQTMLSLIDEANGDGIFWGVFDQKHTGVAIDQLVPQATSFPQADAIIRRVHAMIVHASGDDDVAVRLVAKCDSVDDANLLALAMQTEIMYRKYQGGDGNSSLVDLLSHLNVAPSGADLNANVTINQDDSQALGELELAIPHL